AAPIGLSAVTSPAVALPAGVAMVCSAFLFSAVGSIALARQGSSAVIATQSAEDFFLAATNVTQYTHAIPARKAVDR
ncbi:hypothetical protein ACC699_40755, partial [Rhizobium ruizarguesonis]